MNLYNFDKNKYYTVTTEAHLDPAAAKRGKIRYLYPKSTSTLLVVPDEVEGFKRKFTGTEWIQEAIIPDNFTVIIAKEVEYNALSNELEQAGIKFERTDNVLTITMPDTQENRDIVNAVIAAHDFAAATKAKRKEEIASELVEIDRESIPYIRKFCTNTHTSEDTAGLTKKESEAALLRAELDSISVIK